MKKVSRLSWCCLIVIVSCSFTSFAQNPYFINYTVNNGLASSESYCVIQDSKGYIWVSGDAGISRFDGYEFKTFTTENGLVDNTVFGLHEDHRGRIWCRSLSGRLCYIKNEKVHSIQGNDSLEKIIGAESVINLDVDERDNVYLNCKNRNIIIRVSPPYHKQDIVVEKFKLDNAIEITKIHKQLFLRLSSISVLPFTNKIKWTNAARVTALNCPIKIKSQFRVLGGVHHLFASFGNKLYKFRNYQLVDSVTVKGDIIALYEDKNENLWVGSLENGLNVFKKGNLKSAAGHFFKGESVCYITQDTENGIWFTSLKNGLFYLPYPEVIVYNETALLADNKVTAVARAGKYILAGKSNGELMLINPLSMNYITEVVKDESRIANMINGLKSIGPDSVLITATNSLLYDPNKKKVLKCNFASPFPKFLKNCSEYDNRYYCASGSAEISFMEKRSMTITKSFPFLYAHINSIVGFDQAVWICTSNGLWALHDTSFRYYGDSIPLLKNRVEDIVILPGNVFVLSTKAVGLLIWDRNTRKIHVLDKQDGLAGNTCRKMFKENDSIVWVSTNKGLSKVNAAKRKVLQNYTLENGLSSNEINNVFVDNEKIWIATSHGLCCINKNESFVNPVQPQIYINGLKLKGKNIRGVNSLELGYDQRQLVSVMFTGISYKSLGKCRYKYKLEGLDDTWHFTDVPYVEYNLLEPGKYTMLVYAINNSGISSRFPAKFSFTILAPFWQKRWFIIPMLLLFALLMFLLFRYRLTQLKKRELKNAELNEVLLKLKLKALRAQMNPHFTFNVMNSIQHFILKEDHESAHLYLAKFSKLIRLILQHSEDDTTSIAEEIKALEIYLELEAMRVDHIFEYVLQVDDCIDVHATKIPSMLIQPYVENAVKHGLIPLKKNGKVNIQIKDQGNRLLCVIEDNGVGRTKMFPGNENNQHRSFGTTITQERLAAINQLNNIHLSQQTMDLKDAQGNPIGTRVEIYILKI